MADVTQASLLRLLDLQSEDAAIKRLNERRASLPEAVKLSEVRERLAELSSDTEIAQKQYDEIERENRRLEDEIASIEAKIAKEEKRMFSGSVSNPKELAGLQAEVASLKKRQGTLEDDLLEVMEQKEQAGATLDRLRSQRDGTQKEAEELGRTVEGLTEDIDVQLRDHAARRAEITPDIPEDLLELYDRLREQRAGVGAAALVAGTCEGCHTKLSAREYERIRSAEGLQRCENCRRILVVT